MPSHVDLAGNEKADALADDGVTKHGVRREADDRWKKAAEKRPRQEARPPAQEAKRQRVQPDPHMQPGPDLNTHPYPHPNLAHFLSVYFVS